MNDRQRLEAIVGVVCRHLPPDGIPVSESMSQIIALVDPLPAPVQVLQRYSPDGEGGMEVDSLGAYVKHQDVTTPTAAPDLQAELDATNRQVEILSDALAESRREVTALKAVQDWKKLPPEEPPLVKWAKEQSAPVQEPVAYLFTNVQSGDIEASTNPDHKEGEREMWYREPLVRPPAAAVPDAMTSADIQEHIEYVAGWNECRQTMLEILKAKGNT
jgi:hypothetical protein